jgi:hypothetical protein
MSTPTGEEFETYYRVREHLRWDRKGPFDLLRNSDDLYHSSGTATDFGGKLSIWEVYASGYFNAARELTLVPVDKFFLTFAIYPIIFLYRHYLELELKHLIAAAAKQFGKPAPQMGNHNISGLWKAFQELVPSGHMAAKNNENVERILAQVEELDASSMASRYALEKDFKKQSLPTPRVLDLNVVREVMDRLNTEMKAIDAQLGFPAE